MGEPVRIVDLAKDLIALSGLTVGEDIEIKFTGIRPGEKLFEELSTADEDADKTVHPKIFIGKFRPYPWSAVERGLERLAVVSDGIDREAVKAAFGELVPEFAPGVEAQRRSRPSAEQVGGVRELMN
jgi:FlaA1/EpsC-like NDP-sugar epimerase